MTAADDDDRRAAIIRRARTEGIEAAYEAALAICRDSKAPQQAKSNAARTLLQIGGLFEIRDNGPPKSLGEMTPEELDAMLRELKRERRDIERRLRQVDAASVDERTPGIFD